MQRAQGLRYKYNDRWLSTDNRKFLFRSQTRDNMFWSVVSGCGCWSAYEVATLWAYANGPLRHPQGDRLAPASAPADACYSRQESKGLCAVSCGRVTRAPAMCDACAAIAHSTWRRAVLPSSSSYSGSRPSIRSISALAIR